LLRTTVPGVWAAGDLTPPAPSVANAIASGSTAAAMIVHEAAHDLAVPVSPGA
jgi:thioredoxin reductase